MRTREQVLGVKILVTNDDGVEAPGLSALAQALLDRGHDVLVVAPVDERSGSGTAVGGIEHDRVIGTKRVTLATEPALAAYGLDAPPSLAVLAACLDSFGSRPELVVSGINPGYNTGRSVMFSGTVGAALTAAALGLPGIAVSCGFAPGHRFDTAAQVAAHLVEWLDSAGRPKLTLNVNVPDMDLDQIDGCEVTSMAERSVYGLRMTLEDDLHLRRFSSSDLTPGTDAATVADGRLSLSLLRSIDTDPDFDPSDLLAAMRRLRGRLVKDG